MKEQLRPHDTLRSDEINHEGFTDDDIEYLDYIRQKRSREAHWHEAYHEE